MFSDTIIAISTPLGQGALGIVRLSGERSLNIAKKIFKPNKNSIKIPIRRPMLGIIYNPGEKEYFEKAYMTYFKGPHSYTSEDVVEISCHGSPLILGEVVRLGIKEGARHARPGEFTLRAYLNGRIDLLQAEAVNDIIKASTLRQAIISFHQLEGGLSKRVYSVRSKIIHLLSQIEASIEFPEDGLKISSKQITKTIEKTIFAVRQLTDSYDLGKSLMKGLNLAITGRTNVGKSTLFNSLLEKQRAIVNPNPGTTRDYIQEKIKIKDSFFNLIDMAGLDNAAHPIEEEAMKRSKKLASEANGILLMIDASQKETAEDFELIKKFKNKKMLLLLNKIDLPVKIDIKKIKEMNKALPVISVSALKGINLGKLKEKIHEIFIPGQSRNKEVILHLRQKFILEGIFNLLTKAIQLLKDGYSEEIYSEEIRKTIQLMGQLTGEIRTDEIIEDIFNHFCIGK